jgi:2,3-bisphosphoglycerate-independent phosphoglycerate mutase
MYKKAILIITDGIGYSSKKEWNAFYSANKPFYDYLLKNIPYGMVSTSGLSVGLPEGQMGNSEVGHMTLGGGRIFYQDLVKISKSLETGEFQNLKTYKNLIENSKSDRIHLIGLLSDGGVHSHISHLFGIIENLLKIDKKIYLHIITDGRDVSPISSPIYLEQLLNKFSNDFMNNNIKIASISGRFYTMDRDKRWDRIESGYRVIANGDSKSDLAPLEYLKWRIAIGENDEFITPVSFEDYNGFMENDGILFYNFRSDRMREIVSAIGLKNFQYFERKNYIENIFLITMTNYNDEFNFQTIFDREKSENFLSEYISKNNLKQFHIAETEKYAHVTFFFNGGTEEPFAGESRYLVPSPKVKTYDEKPEMSATEVCDEVIKAIHKNIDFIVVNFANGDMVGHTGVFEAGIKAVETVDKQLGRIFEESRKNNYSIVLTSDHGNCEEMRDDKGNILTNHTIGDVWCFVIDERVKTVQNGGLNHIAPTILKLIGLNIPTEMSKALIDF